MTNREFLKGAVAFVAMLLLAYLTGAFVSADANSAHWDMALRAFVAVFGLMGAGIAFAVAVNA